MSAEESPGGSFPEPGLGPPASPAPASSASGGAPSPPPGRSSSGASGARPAGSPNRLRLGAVIAVALGIGFLVWLLVHNGGASAPAPAPSPPAPRPAPAVAATTAQLRRLAASKPFPLYWLGPQAGHIFELTQTAAGNVYIRYLPHNVPVGVSRPVYVTVGTYPERDGFATVTQASHLPGESIHRLSHGGLAVSSPKLPMSVYFSYPGSRYLVEVFDPAANHALALVKSGRVRPLR